MEYSTTCISNTGTVSCGALHHKVRSNHSAPAKIVTERYRRAEISVTVPARNKKEEENLVVFESFLQNVVLVAIIGLLSISTCKLPTT